MKKLISLVICVLVAVFGCTFANAESELMAVYQNDQYGFYLELPSQYTAIDRSTLSKNREFIEKIGYSVESFSAKLEQSDIVMYAATEDNDRQVQVKYWQSDFSKSIGNMSALNDEKLSTALKAMAEPLMVDENRILSSAVGKAGDIVYLYYVVQVEGKFCYTEYITVVNGYCYSLVYYNSSAEFSEAELNERDGIVLSFDISGASSKSIWGGYSLAVRIISAALLIVAAVVAVYIVSSFVRDIRNRRNSPEVIPDRIKMKHK